LGSFIQARADYALARLECAMHAPDLPAPPPVDRLSEATEHALRVEWPPVEHQLERAVGYGERVARIKGAAYREDAAYRALDRTLREMDQYARAIRWVLTVTDREDVGDV
jgi:hypothetical protein